MVTCPYCSSAAEQVGGDVIYPHRPDLAAKRFWRCKPCDAYCGSHPDGKPLGRLANAELRRARNKANALFDPLWRSGVMRRGEAYEWLQKLTGLSKAKCHIAMMDLPTVRRTIDALTERLGVSA